MSTNVAAWFQQVWNSEVKIAYQQKQAKLRNTVRTKTNVKAEITHFPLADTMEVGEKESGGLVPVSNPDMTKVSCTLSEKFGGAYVDKIDEIQHNSDERGVHTTNAAAAHGRHTDKMIITAAMQANDNVVGDFTTGLSLELVQLATIALDENEVPDDGERTALVTPRAWQQLMKLEEFSSADFIGQDKLPWVHADGAKRWNGCLWTKHTGLTRTTTQATCLIYHKTAIGHAIGQDLTTTWSWENTRNAWFLNTNMFQGACLIDGKGVVKIQVKNDGAL